MRGLGDKSRTCKGIMIACALAGALVSTPPTYAGPVCASVPPELGAPLPPDIDLGAPLPLELAVPLPRKVAVVTVTCHRLSDKQLHRVNGQGFTLRVDLPPRIQESVILWDEVTGGQGGGTHRLSAHSSGSGNRQTSSATFSSR